MSACGESVDDGGGGGAASGGATSASGGSSSSGGGQSSGGEGPGSGGQATGDGGGDGSGGALGSGGGDGSGGSVGMGDCPDELVGWATVSGDGVGTTVGGGSATPVRPRTAQELIDYAKDDEPRVIEIEGTFDVPRLEVTSRKTLVGIGSNATIRGGVRIRGRASALVHDVILRNLRIDGATTTVDNDAVQLYFAHHVWIDHSEIWDGPDGNLDMTHAVNWVTVSWTKFRYTEAYRRPSGESSDHRFNSLLGHSDNNASEDEGRLKVSFHHNWWAERVIERMPRVRFGQVHVFNNYFASPGNNYCVRAGRGARLLIEGNYFDAVNSPHEFNSSSDQATAHITARDNVYHQTTGTQATAGGGAAFTSAPYEFSLRAASEVPEIVKACAGPRP